MASMHKLEIAGLNLPTISKRCRHTIALRNCSRIAPKAESGFAIYDCSKAILPARANSFAKAAGTMRTLVILNGWPRRSSFLREILRRRENSMVILRRRIPVEAVLSTARLLIDRLWAVLGGRLVTTREEARFLNIA